jgi:DNA-binding beta-propeller fold protein YncE
MLALLLAAPPPAFAAEEYVLQESIPGADGGWDFAAVDPTTNRLFVARSNGVMAVELSSRKVTDVLVAAAGAHGVIPIPQTSYAISSNGNTASATIFDKTTGRIEATIPTGTGPDAIVFEPKTGLVLVFNAKSLDATLIDPKSKSALGSISLGGKPEVAAADGSGRVFVNIEDKNEIAVIDLPSRKIVGSYALPGCDAPTGLAFDAVLGVLISACGNNIAKVIDAATGADLVTLKIGKGPDGVLLDATRRRALIPSGDGVLTVIALKARGAIAPIGSVRTAPSARTGALDPATGAAYLPSATLLPPEKEGARPKRAPGSFKILVLVPQDSPHREGLATEAAKTGPGGTAK